MQPTHALFSGDRFLGEVLPSGYLPANLVPLPANYYTPGFVWTWQKRTPVEDVAKVEAYLVDQVKAEAERRKMLVRTRGSGKSEEYREKREEALASASLTAAVLNALTRPVAAVRYPAAAYEAQLIGDPLATVLDRYRVASAPKNTEVLRLAAIEQAGCRSIRTGTTAPAKRAAFAAVSWSWQPA